MHRIFRITILSKKYDLIDKIDISPFIIAASLHWGYRDIELFKLKIFTLHKKVRINRMNHIKNMEKI